MTIAYLDLPSGLSGDMFLGCLVDAGWLIDALRAELGKLSLPGESYELHHRSVMKGSMRATQVAVTIGQSKDHRHLSDVRTIINSSFLSQKVKDRALGIFTRLAAAEAKVHGMGIEEVHFHEVGAVDAIVDIVGAAAGIDALGIEKLYASKIPIGEGMINCEHGLIPLPAPATLEMLAAAGAHTKPAPGPGELVTPTGAAIICELATFGQPIMQLQRIGLGAGMKDFRWPNIARLWIGQSLGATGMVQIDTNIDDMNPQLYPVVSDQLFSKGATDVWFTPIQMKKGRPGTMLSVLAPRDKEPALAETILRETTTLGMRVHEVSRHEAGRDFKTVSTQWGDVRVKLKIVDGKAIGATPEFEDCRKISVEKNVPVKLVQDEALRLLGNLS